MPRGSTLAAALSALLALALPGVARPQVAPPRLVEEGEPDEPAATPSPRNATSQPSADAPPPAKEPAPPPAAVAPPSVHEPPPTPQPSPQPAGAPLGPPASRASEPARKVVPVKMSWSKLMEAWEARRRALHEGDPAGADAAQKLLLSAQRELGIENLVPFAAAEVRAVGKALSSHLPAEALSRAEVAVSLAPDWPEAHLTRARALLSGGASGAAMGAVADAAAAVLRDPQAVRALQGDLLAALLAGLAAACTVALLILALSRLRLFLHDFHHLPLVRGAPRAQGALVALALLAAPAALGLGPLAVLSALALSAWLYLSLRERLLATAALAALFLAPWAAQRAASRVVWTGTPAERVHRIEHGALTDEEAAAEVKALPENAPEPLLAALGRHLKRRGDLEGALRLYRAAAAADPHAAEVQVDIGNVLFLQDDVDGARKAYLAAQDQADGDLVVRGTAAYDLSKLFIRTAEMEKSSAARANAEQMAGAFLAGRGSDEDFSANRYLVDVPVPPAKVAALAAADAAPAALRAWLERALLRSAAGASWAWTATGILAALWLLSLLGPGLDPSHPCSRCGRPVCRRCDGVTGRSCGQCVNVFERRGVVEVRDRLRKERQVRLHSLWGRRAARALALLLGGGGHLLADAPVRGALVIAAIASCAALAWSLPGVAPPPYPSSLALAAKLGVAVPLGLVVWALSVRDLFRRTGG